ncbi:FAD/NAD(P)-binding protein [Endozoicomonas sp. ONNA1]|uniref:FAD/NAD(P)-binding protein n=2 Tax=unclassified Endozoicomonas TaxID=2644528 RepID=UPI0021473CE8|nr:FAD/NAD(P)-binding protein [Endozoicomonas sp. ONNA1]
MASSLIIGAGPTGICTFIELVKNKLATRIIFVDPNEIGIGYGFKETTESMLCNTSAGVNSLVPGEKEDFISYCRSIGLAIEEDAFLPRSIMNDYIFNRYNLYRKLAIKNNIHIEFIRDKVSYIYSCGSQVKLESGKVVDSKNIFVCIGSVNKSDIGQGAYSKLKEKGEQIYNNGSNIICPSSVAIIGSKLSAIDQAIDLCKRGCNVTMISKSGELPAVRNELMIYDNKLSYKKAKSKIEIVKDINKVIRAYNKEPLHILTKERLNQEIILSRRENGWQTEVGDIIEYLNNNSSLLSNRDIVRLKKKYRRFISRYISSIPVQNGKLLLEFIDNGSLNIIKGSYEDLEWDRNWKIKKTFMNFDCVVVCDGLANPGIIKRSDGNYSFTYKNKKDYVSISELEKKSIWLVGSTAASEFLIVNYIRFSVSRVERLIKQLKAA